MNGGPFNQILKKRCKATIYSKMKTNTQVTMALLIRFALSFLWFVVECSQNGHFHGQLGEQQLQSLLVLHKLSLFSFM
jgi:hypothetical protein